MSDSVIVEADGGSRGNPGPAGYGAVVMDVNTGEVLAERSESIGIETNNVAEYRGLIAGLQAARDVGAQRVAVRMDSKLVVEQMKGVWQVKHPGLRPLAREASQLKAGFAEISFQWIPREKNKHADRLANEAMDRAAGKTPRPARATATPTPTLTQTPSATQTPTAGALTSAAPSWMPQTGARTRLMLLRHGATAHSAERRFSGRNDLPLNDVGTAQAAALARRDFGQVAAIVSSPLRRTRQTAETVGAALGLPVTVLDDLAELDFGVFEGLSFSEARAAYPAELAAWQASPDEAPPGGESFTALARRVRRGRDSLVANYPDATVLVVTHVSPIKMLVRAALDAPLASIYRMHLDTASVTSLDYLADGSSSLRLFNDTSHLPTA